MLSPILSVNEIYGPVRQGEGRSAGELVSFLRLSGCNLACQWCDTPYTWNWSGTKFTHLDKFDKEDEVHKYSIGEVKSKLDSLSCYRVVISGGEPFLQQYNLLPLLRELKSDAYFIEVETNGTVRPLPEFVDLVDQINCSPKTENSGPDNRAQIRERPATLKILSDSPKTSFKFVVSSEDDMPEIVDLSIKYHMREAYLMPQGRTRDEQERLQDKVRELATRYHFRFSPRLHVLQFNALRGV